MTPPKMEQHHSTVSTTEGEAPANTPLAGTSLPKTDTGTAQELNTVKPPLSATEKAALAVAAAGGPPNLRGQALLKEMRRQERLVLLYEGNPPRPRERAPYPEGDVLYECNGRVVVRNGNLATKYTDDSNGMGRTDTPNEAIVLKFIKENTTIPVPKVISSDWDRITMEHIPGQPLREAWPSLTEEQRSNILEELRGYIKQLRELKGTRIERLDGQGPIVCSILTRSGDPFDTIADFHYWLSHPPKRTTRESIYWHQIAMGLGEDHEIVFTHGDIAARNILIREGRIAAIIDWEFAGWYPAYWEYVFALRGLDNVDWNTLGTQVPSLFEEKYDQQYLAVRFILSLT